MFALFTCIVVCLLPHQCQYSWHSSHLHVLLCVNQVHDMTTAIYGIVLMEPSTWSSGPLRLTHFCSVTVPAEVWDIQKTSGESPPPLFNHTFTRIDHHRAVVFGGCAGSSWENYTYVLDMKTWVIYLIFLLIFLCCAYCLASGDQEWKHYNI